MKLRHFLDAGYAILHEEYQRYKLNLFDATEQLKEFAAGYNPVDEQGQPVPVGAEQETRANEQAYAQLREQMKSTGIVLP